MDETRDRTGDDPVNETPPVQDDTAAPAGPIDTEQLKSAIVAALKTVYDPEIPVDIYELGLIYAIDIGQDGSVSLQMTLTSPACPVAGSLPGEVEAKVRDVPGVSSTALELVWDPPWDQEKMSDAAKVTLGFF